MTWEFIRVLFPRWNFFDRLGFRLELEVKPAGGSDWQQIPFVASRTMGGLFISPDLTRLHAEKTLLENFVDDVQKLIDPDGKIESARVQKLTSFKMMRFLIGERLKSSSGNAIQFRVSARAADEVAVLYVSDAVGVAP